MDWLGFDIADDEHLAWQTVEQPFSISRGGEFRMIPMPSMPRRVDSAFFAPIVAAPTDRASTAFDLVVVGAQGRPIAFRFEPADEGAEQRHGYDHVQLSEKVAHRSVKMNEASDSTAPRELSRPAATGP